MRKNVLTILWIVVAAIAFLLHWLLAVIVGLFWILIFINQKSKANVVIREQNQKLIVGAEKDLLEKQIEIERAKSKMEVLMKKVNELNQQNQNNFSKMNVLDKEISEKKERLKKVDEGLAEREERIKKQKADLEKQFNQLGMLKEKYEESLRLNIVIRLKQEVVSKSENELTFIQKTIDEQQLLLAKLREEEKKEIQSKKLKIESLDRMIANKNSEILEREKEIGTLNNCLDVLKQEIYETEKSSAERMVELNEISAKLATAEEKLIINESQLETYKTDFKSSGREQNNLNKIKTLTNGNKNMGSPIKKEISNKIKQDKVMPIPRKNKNDENSRFFITNKEFILQINKLPLSKLTSRKIVEISLYDDETGHLIRKSNNVPLDKKGKINYETILLEIHKKLRFTISDLDVQVYDSKQNLYRDFFIFDEDGLEILDDIKPSGKFSILVDASVGVRMETVGKYMPKKKMFMSFKIYEFNGKQVKGIVIKKRELFTGPSKITASLTSPEIHQNSDNTSNIIKSIVFDESKKSVDKMETNNISASKIKRTTIQLDEDKFPKHEDDREEIDFEKELLELARL